MSRNNFVSIGNNCMHQNPINYHAENTNCIDYPPAGEAEILWVHTHYHHSLENNNYPRSVCSGLSCQWPH